MRPSRPDVLAAGLASYAAICLAYSTTNLWHWRPPTVLPWSGLDDAVPFLDWTVWIYLSHFALVAWGVLAVAQGGDARRLLPAGWATLLCCAVFIAYPTAIDPWPQAPGPLFAPAFRLLERLNTPANALPSMHVVLAALAAWSLRDAPGRRWAFAWAAVVCLSTVTAKQHTVVDVPAGLAVVWLALKLSELRVSRAPSRLEVVPG